MQTNIMCSARRSNSVKLGQHICATYHASHLGCKLHRQVSQSAHTKNGNVRVRSLDVLAQRGIHSHACDRWDRFLNEPDS